MATVGPQADPPMNVITTNIYMASALTCSNHNSTPRTTKRNLFFENFVLKFDPVFAKVAVWSGQNRGRTVSP